MTSESELKERDTNYVCIDRHDILGTTFSELASIANFHLTFEVDFKGEKAKDLGGPRKEWIRLMNLAIKEKYFDHGLRQYLADDYYYVGIMVGIALLQNGQLPTFLPLNLIEELVKSTSECCILNLQRGLHVFGLLKIFQKVPVLLHLLKPTTHKLAARMLLHLLSPKFSEEGSSTYQRSKATLWFICEIRPRSFKRPKRCNHFEPYSGICHWGFRGASARICSLPLHSIFLCVG